MPGPAPVRVAAVNQALPLTERHPGAALDAAETLRRHAALVAGALASTGAVSERWFVPRFVREVDRVRGHLAPIRSHHALAESYRRESFRGARSALIAHRASTLARSPAEVAYALRWLELAGRLRPAGWLDLLTGHGSRFAG